MKKILFILLSVLCFTNTKAQLLNANFCQTNGIVYSVAVDSAHNTVYIGGTFSQVCGTARNKLAALNLTTGALLPWNPGANNVVMSLYIHNNALYVGGQFTSIASQAHKCVAKFYIPAGNIVSGWNPAITTGNVVNTIVARGSRVYIGGDILMTVGTGNHICDLDTGTAGGAGWTDYPNNIVNSLSIDGNKLYAGGSFTMIGTTPQNYLAKFDISGAGTLDAWDPAPDAAVWSVCARSGRLFVGGLFSLIGTDNREKIAEVDVTTAAATAWNPGSDNAIQDIKYRAGVVYAVGNFSIIGGKTRPFVAALDVNTGIATSWNAQINGTIEQIAVSQGQLFAGGSFTSAVGQPRTDFAVLCVNPIDTIPSGPVGPLMVCNGLSGVSYSIAAVAGATSYVWGYTGSGVTINGTSNVVTVDFSSSATGGDLTVKATNGCETSNLQSGFINTYSFTTTLSPTTNNIICGDSVDINSGDNYSGSGSITYSWAPVTGLNATNVSNVTSGSHATITYTFTETSSEGCVATDMATITVSPFNLTTGIQTPSILCSTTDSLHVTNDYPGAGSVTYTWSPSGSVSLPNGSNVNSNPVVSTDYTVTASATGGCAATPQTVFVIVNPISVTASNSGGIITCGDITQLGATNDYPGTGTLTYTWTPNTALSDDNILNPNANPIVTTSYTLTLNSPEGCVSEDQTTINVNALQVTVTNTVNTGCHQPVTLSTSANSTNAGLTYSWTPSAGLSSTTSADPTAIVGGNTTYNVTMSLPSSGCSDASNSVSISLTPPNTPQICMVTVDSASTHNIVYWDKTGFASAAIDSFRIYREVTTGVYGIVGTVHYNALSEFHDFGANPNVTTYRYKISAVDSCGLESQLSFYHNTVYIIYAGNGQYTWNPGYTIEPTTNPVNNYLLMRDDNNVGIWHQVQSTSGSQNTIADPAWASFPLANWQVVTSWGISCSPTARQSNGIQAAIVKSKSNISNNRPMNNSQLVFGTEEFVLYPNPTNGNLTINFANATTGKVNIKVISAIGQEVFNETFTQANEKRSVDLNKYENGIYLVQITTNNATTVKRIVKN